MRQGEEDDDRIRFGRMEELELRRRRRVEMEPEHAVRVGVRRLVAEADPPPAAPVGGFAIDEPSAQPSCRGSEMALDCAIASLRTSAGTATARTMRTCPTTSPVGTAVAASVTFRLAFLAVMVPVRLWHAASVIAVSFTGPVTPVQDFHRAARRVPFFDAFRFAFTGAQTPPSASFPSLSTMPLCASVASPGTIGGSAITHDVSPQGVRFLVPAGAGSTTRARARARAVAECMPTMSRDAAARDGDARRTQARTTAERVRSPADAISGRAAARRRSPARRQDDVRVFRRARIHVHGRRAPRGALDRRSRRRARREGGSETRRERGFHGHLLPGHRSRMRARVERAATRPRRAGRGSFTTRDPRSGIAARLSSRRACAPRESR
jgi:hypothetical protein